MLKEEKLFDIKINCFDYGTLEESMSFAIQNGQNINIFYVNFFSVNIAKNDSTFRHIINSTDIIFPDGTGIWLGSKIVTKNYFNKRFNLTDNGFKLLNYFSQNNLSVFLFGGNSEILEQAKIKIHSNEPNLSISGSLNGYTNNSDNEIVNIINLSNPDVLMVGLGTPKQEEWIYNNRSKLRSKIIISVGDLIRLYSGQKKRGPKIIRNLGFEWVIRLITAPQSYYRRYLLGIPKFIFYVMQEYFKQDHK